MYHHRTPYRHCRNGGEGGGGGRDPAGMLTQQAVINVTQHTAERTAWGPGAGMWRGRKNG